VRTASFTNYQGGGSSLGPTERSEGGERLSLPRTCEAPPGQAPAASSLNARVVVKRAIVGDHTLLIAVVDTRVDVGVGTYVVTADVAVLAKKHRPSAG
jgi:hypothetical protein